MRRRKATLTALIATASAGLITATAILAPGAPARADDYPSWQDVEAAKGNAQTAQAELSKIRDVVNQLQDASDRAAADELAKQAVYTEAENKLHEAESTEKKANVTVTKARQASEKANADYGRFVSSMYGSGGTDFTTQLVLSGSQSSTLLHGLEASSVLTAHADQLRNQAQVLKNQASAAEAQAKTAKSARQDLATRAETAYQDAQSASQAAAAALQTEQQHSDTLAQQAASLANTAVDVEKNYQAGVQARAAAAAAAKAAAARKAASASPNVAIGGATADPNGAKAYAASQLGNYGWGSGQMGCLISLWTQESGWRANAYNASSGAYGIPQALPAGKMATAGSDWMTNQQTQINWGLNYIKLSYGSPCGAWNHEMSVNPHWY